MLTRGRDKIWHRCIDGRPKHRGSRTVLFGLFSETLAPGISTDCLDYANYLVHLHNQFHLGSTLHLRISSQTRQ